MKSPFRYFDSSPEVIRLVVLMYVRYPLSLRNVEDLLFERGIDIRHETVRLWWNRFGPMFAAGIWAESVKAETNWLWTDTTLPDRHVRPASRGDLSEITDLQTGCPRNGSCRRRVDLCPLTNRLSKA